MNSNTWVKRCVLQCTCAGLLSISVTVKDLYQKEQVMKFQLEQVLLFKTIWKSSKSSFCGTADPKSSSLWVLP